MMHHGACVSPKLPFRPRTAGLRLLTSFCNAANVGCQQVRVSQMVSKIFRARYFAMLVVFLWMWGKPIHAESLVQDFESLFERCRVSIETSSLFDNGDLERRDVPDRHVRDWGVSSSQEAWIYPGAELYVLLAEWTSRDGTVRHRCDIRLFDEEYVLRPIEQALLLRHFLIRQVELIGSGTHEIDKQMSPIPPAVNVAFLLLDRNPNGCIVSNSFTFTPDGEFLSVVSGEQAVKHCKFE